MEKILRIDEVLNSLIARKTPWTDDESKKHAFIITEEKGEKLRYVFDKKDGYLIAIQRKDEKVKQNLPRW